MPCLCNGLRGLSLSVRMGAGAVSAGIGVDFGSVGVAANGVVLTAQAGEALFASARGPSILLFCRCCGSGVQLCARWGIIGRLAGSQVGHIPPAQPRFH